MAKSTIATAYVQVRPSMEGVAAEVRKQYDPAATTAGVSFGSNMVGALKKYITAAAIGKALKESILQGGALEQSIGGVTTLFGEEAAKTVIDNAKKAYQAAGISANQYMETVTSFSASLLSSLGGNAAEAARVADMAIVDMSDNANKMGTSMESIQAAYQGFAKGQYQLLDNLKLGYGGTKTEMERLLKHAQEITGVKYDIKNLSDVYSAIHVIQEELGITGATANEASTTLIGSFNAMKAAAMDVMGYLALGMDVTPALNALAETVATFLVGNLLPMVFNIVTALPSALFTFIQALIPSNVLAVVSNLVGQLTTFISTSLPQILASGTAIITELMNGFINGYPSYLFVVGSLMVDMISAILSNIPNMINSGITLIGTLASGLQNNMPAILAAIGAILAKLLAAIASNLPNMLESGIALIGQLAAGLITAVGAVISAIFNVNSNANNAFLAFDWSSIGQNIVSGVARGISAFAGSIASAARSAALSAYRSAKAALGIASPSKLMRDQIGKFIPQGIAVGIEANTDSVTNAMKGLSTLTADTFTEGFDYTGAAPATGTYGNNTFTFYIYGSEGQSVEELAEVVAEKIQGVVNRKGAVFA